MDSTPTSTLLTPAAATTGAAAIAMAIYHVVTPGPPGATFGSPGDWFRDLSFLVYLAGAIVSFTAAHRVGLATRAPTLLVGVGYGLIFAGAAIGLALQDDPDWFFLLAGPGLLASTVGHVWFAISTLRRRVLPIWAASLAGVGGAVAIIMGELGTSVLIGAFWLSVGFGRLPAWRPSTRSEPDDAGLVGGPQRS